MAGSKCGAGSQVARTKKTGDNSAFREEKMERRIPRDRRPCLEEFERRDLLSAITDIMSANSLAQSVHAQTVRESAFNAASQALAARGSSSSIALPQNQGPQGANLALVPTGTLTKREQRRERFVAKYVGNYTMGAGRTSTEANDIFITGAGTANTMLHSDIQMLLITPTDPSTPISGVSTIFDRNINTNTVLGIDLATPIQEVDRGGRPNNIQAVTLDVNISAGAYVDGFAQGTIKIHYIPSGKHSPGVISQGKAIVMIRAQIYSANASFILRNAGIDP
jgi:hypothetical protein